MKKYRLVDNTLGWIAFLIAAVVYCLTVEPTASFWDCPEFITTGYKLEVGHPPGAPFFMLTANIFSQFASDPTQVAYMVNIMNALLSAMCIMFLFWTITHLARKLILKDWSELTTGKLIAIEASGLVGALIYTFSDTFWYSAVEGEVYAYSSAFTAVVFWLILKWEDNADKPHSDRWLVLIAYMTGLSIGVHLLNLLCIPAIVLVYYYRRFPDANLKGSIIALLISFVVVTAVLYGVVPGIITVGGWFELLFVNVLHMPFNSGLYVYIVLLVAIVIWAIYETYVNKSVKRQNISFLLSIAMLGIPFYGWGWSAVVIGIIVLAIIAFILTRKRNAQQLVSARIKNTILLCLLMLMIGYSSYAVIMIRSAANTPMDQNSPEDIFTLGNYLSRDQYGYRPLLFGQAYKSEYLIDNQGNVQFEKGAPIYQRKEKASKDEPDRYFIVSTKDKPKYAQNMFFPRMYSAAHTDSYEMWFGGSQDEEGNWIGGIKGSLKKSNYRDDGLVKIPTFIENLKFFFSYQCNFMYWRYFLWNFAGRQNDIQGNGEPEKGNWLTGIPFIDNTMLGDQSLLPDDLKNNKGRNVFYCLPLLLGLLGLFWQAFRGQRGIRQFWVVFFLFFMTGIAIVIYLNQTPNQPRERDYAYAGSFYAYAIWCGLGVLAIVDLLKKYFKLNGVVVSSVVGLLALLIPIQMVSQTWDDHDRSGRYMCRDFGQNYLMSLQQEGNPIIFTNGDNDTFPLWYNQETEGVGTNARVCNLSYLQTDWYIDQMKRPAYDSPAVPINWARIEYCEGTNTTIEVHPEMKTEVLAFYKKSPEEAKKKFGEEPFELKNILKYWVRSKDPDFHYIPTDTIYITIDKEAVKRSGMTIYNNSLTSENFNFEDWMKMLDSDPNEEHKMTIALGNQRYLEKRDVIMLEMLANCNWERPLYIATTVGESNYIADLNKYLIQEGLAYRITPYKNRGRLDTEKTYDAIMNRFKNGGLEKPGLYLDETIMRMCYNHRRLYAQLALELCQEEKMDKAAKVLAKMEKDIPEYNVPMTWVSGGAILIQAYGMLDNTDKVNDVANKLWKYSEQYVKWYLSLSPQKLLNSDCAMHLQIMNNVLDVTERFDSEWAQKHEKPFEQLIKKYENAMKQGAY